MKMMTSELLETIKPYNGDANQDLTSRSSISFQKQLCRVKTELGNFKIGRFFASSVMIFIITATTANAVLTNGGKVTADSIYNSIF